MGSDPLKACTIIARNYIPFARVLAESYAEHHSGEKISVLLLDDLNRTVDPANEPFDVLRPSDLDLSQEEFHTLAVIYGVMELATAVKPWLLQHLLDQGADAVIYLDPDIQVFAPLTEVGQLAKENDIVLTPHALHPMPRDGKMPNESDILRAGTYNLGFIAVSPNAKPFLSWWSERLKIDCIISAEEGLFVDQRWVEFVPGYFKHHMLRESSYNVAYWNLANREMSWDGKHYRVDGQPLHFFHFSGYRPELPYLLSKHQGTRPRILLSEDKVVSLLCNNYGQKLKEHKYDRFRIKINR